MLRNETIWVCQIEEYRNPCSYKEKTFNSQRLMRMWNTFIEIIPACIARQGASHSRNFPFFSFLSLFPILHSSESTEKTITFEWNCYGEWCCHNNWKLISNWLACNGTNPSKNLVCSCFYPLTRFSCSCQRIISIFQKHFVFIDFEYH